MRTRHAVVLTAYNRTEYIKEVLQSWVKVRGLPEWDFYISLNKSEYTNAIKKIIDEHIWLTGMRIRVLLQSETLTILEHHVEIIDYLFSDGYEFVVRTDDDLVVSNDILEYYDFCAKEYYDDEKIVSVHAYSEKEDTDLYAHEKRTEFSPWVYGFWNHKWPTLIENWDRDYSTYEGTPGNLSGYDWNFNLRVYPKYGFFGIYPSVCRVKNIGAWGTHGTPELLPPAVGFKLNNEKVF